METLTLVFISTLGFIGSFHLLSTTVERFSKGLDKHGEQHKPREEWFCFFQLSDLYGERQNTTGRMNKQVITSRDERLDERRRSQSRRPRLQA